MADALKHRVLTKYTLSTIPINILLKRRIFDIIPCVRVTTIDTLK